MEFWIKASQLLLCLSIIVVLHEFGHYLPAKLFKTRVEKFYLFFNPWFSLIKKKIGETEYGIGWLPLGGYVKISGMIDESMDKEQMSKPPEPYEFRSKPAWQRLIIMVGGVTVNLILAYIIYAFVLFAYGKQNTPVENLVYGVQVDSLAAAAGFQNGDKILSYDQKGSNDILELNKDIMLYGTRDFVIERNGEVKNISLPEDVDYDMLNTGTRMLFAPRYPFIVDSLLADQPAFDSGLLKGDSIISFNETPIKYWDEFLTLMEGQAGETINIGYHRNGKNSSVSVTADENSLIGIGPLRKTSRWFQSSKEQFGFFESFPAGIEYGNRTLKGYVYSMKFIFTKAGASEIGGFGAIGNLFPSKWNWRQFWMLTALISIILAFMNILPIPALDGGHVMFLLYEIIVGKAPSQKFMEYAQVGGMIFLILLLLYANGNDVFKWITNK